MRAQIVLIPLITMLLVAQRPNPIDAAQHVPWAPDLSEAQRLAELRNQLVLMHFWSPDCAPCQRLEATVFSDPGFGRIVSDAYVPVKVNARQFPSLAYQYGVNELPTDVVTTPGGRPIHKMRSPPDAGEYSSLLHQIATRQMNGTQLPPAGSMEPDRRWGVPASGLASYGSTGNSRYEPSAGGYSEQNVYGRASSGSARASMVGERHASQPYASQPYPSQYSNNAYGDGQYTSQPPGAQTYPPRTSFPRSEYDSTSISSSAEQNSGSAPAAVREHHRPPLSEEIHNRYVSRGAQRPPSAGEDLRAGDRGTGAGGPAAGYSPRSSASAVSPDYASRPTDLAAPSMSSSYSEPPGYATAREQASPATGPYRQYGNGARDSNHGPQPQPPSGLTSCLDGYCPVALVEEFKWLKGDPRWGVTHRGRTYVFSSVEAKQRFWAEPDRYSPALSGIDPVLFVDSGQQIQGRRHHGLIYQDRIYLFSGEDTLDRFTRRPELYAEHVRQATRNADRQGRWR